MANIKDVAREAGVGIATVSRVLNNSGYVKKETKEKIERVIKELGYMPNEIARSMTKQKTDTIAFIVPNSMHMFFSELVYYVEEELYEHGYKLMVCNSSEKIEKELVYLDMLKNNKVDAVVLLTNNDIEHHLNKDLPLISFDRRFEGVPFVTSDNYKGGQLAAKRLIELGCKNVMFIGDDAQGDNTPVTTEVTKRRKGFVHYIENHGGIGLVNIEYPLGDYFITEIEINELIKDYPDVDGVFCVSDPLALAVIKALESKGKKVPEDVKVIGFDGGRSFLNLGKKITSVSQNPKKIAQAIFELIEAYKNKEKIEDKFLDVHLEEGDTA